MGVDPRPGLPYGHNTYQPGLYLNMPIVPVSSTECLASNSNDAIQVGIPSDERLLLENAAQHSQPSDTCPEATASLPSLFTYHWLDAFIWMGYQRPITMENLKTLSESYEAATLTDAVETALFREQRESVERNRPFELWRVLWTVFGGRWGSAGILKLISDSGALVTPYLLSLLIGQVEVAMSEDGNVAPAVYLALLLFSLSVFCSFSVNYYFQMVMTQGLKVRTGLNGAIYRKVFRLSESGKCAFSSGKLLNLVSVDTARLDFLAGYLHYTWSAILQTVVIITLLLYSLGISALAGVAILIVSIPYQRFTMQRLSTLRKASVGVTDERVKRLQECFQSMRLVKTYNWESWFFRDISELRDAELNNLKRLQVYRAILTSISFAIPMFASIATFGLYRLLGNPLEPTVIFPSLALFNLLRLPLMLFPMVASISIDARVSLRRLRDFFLADELHFAPDFLLADSPLALQMKQASFTWAALSNDKAPAALGDKAAALGPTASKTSLANSVDAPRFRLTDLNLEIPKGSLVAIIGPVGSGKTSLFSSLVGEMEHEAGQVAIGGSLGYCPQQAWNQNASVRENILFGLPYDSARYQHILKACSLIKDMESFSNGDRTEIGEKGITLSGGQKQRIGLARMLYAQKDLLLMDDPLSAVDAHVGRHIFKHCILPKHKLQPTDTSAPNALITRILITHQLWVVRQTDWIIAMEHGHIAYQGSFAHLLAAEPRFSQLLEENGLLPSSTDASNVSHESMSMDSTSILASGFRDQEPAQPAVVEPKKGASAQSGHVLMRAEERAIGAVKSSVYWAYISSAGGVTLCCTIAFLLVLAMGARVATDLWLAYWTARASGTAFGTGAPSNVNQPDYSLSFYLSIYAGFGLLQILFMIVFSLAISFSGLIASRTLFARAFQTVLSARLVFFDTTPLGRILNRFTRDMDGIDNTLSDAIRSFCTTLGQSLSSLALMTAAAPAFIPFLVVLLALYAFVQHVYRANARELKRLDSITKSPLLAHFAESLSGLSVIRASSSVTYFQTRQFDLADTNNLPLFYQISLQRWLALRLEMIGHTILLVISLLLLCFSTSPSLYGLLIGYALSLNGVLNWAVRQASDVEVQMNAVERLLYYAEAQQIPTEPLMMDDTDYHKGWDKPLASCIPAIEFDNVSLKYRDDLPPSLVAVSFRVEPGERVGILGRTGAGKSTLLSALLRLTEIEENGYIRLHGTPTSCMSLESLRGYLVTVILQDPVFFTGTIRQNLDPLGHATDLELWAILEQVYLKDFVTEDCPAGLDSTMNATGDPFSLGQRQLLSLGRALLKIGRTKYGILVMDEATANIDMSTDALIQNTLRKLFTAVRLSTENVSSQRRWTILTIAHRIATVMDYDRLIILEQGRVKEIGSPAQLAADPTSIFSALLSASAS